MLSGRYYANILRNPLMRPAIKDALDSSGISDMARLSALEGHVPGVHNSVDPSDWKSNRAEMARIASEVAKSELLSYWKGQSGSA